MIDKRFFSKLKRDGLIVAEIHYKGNVHHFDASTRLPLPRKPVLWAIVAVSLIALGIGIVKLATPAKQTAPKTTTATQTTVLPAADYNQLATLISEQEIHAVSAYLGSHSYRDTVDAYGWSALHWAAFTGNRAIYDSLVSAGASPQLRSTRAWFTFGAGITPAELLQTHH